MATQEISLGSLGPKASQGLAQVDRAAVLDHSALAPGIGEQPLGDPKLVDPRVFRRVRIRLGERIPVHEVGLHGSMVGFARRMLNQRAIEFGDNAGDPDRLLLGDCMEIQPSLEGESFDLAYMDPPFGTGTTRKNEERSYQDLLSDPEAFVEWLRPCLEHSHRVLAATGSLFVHLDYRAVHYVKVALDRIFGRDNFVNEIIWCYSVGGKSRRSFGKKHDTILWYAKSSAYQFFPKEVVVPRKAASHMRVVLDESGQPIQEKTDKKTGKVYRYPVNAGKVPEDWWTDIETLNRSDRERVGWPTQKPTRLLERVVKATTEPGQRVADWFSGSGTTAVVAQRLGRSFTVMDRAPSAIECALERLRLQGHALAAEGRCPPKLVVEGRSLSPQDGASGSRQEC